MNSLITEGNSGEGKLTTTENADQSSHEDRAAQSSHADAQSSSGPPGLLTQPHDDDTDRDNEYDNADFSCGL